jgi:hypothetical protein
MAVSFIVSICSSLWNNSAPTRQIFIKIYNGGMVTEICQDEVLKMGTNILGTLHEDKSSTNIDSDMYGNNEKEKSLFCSNGYIHILGILPVYGYMENKVMNE